MRHSCCYVSTPADSRIGMDVFWNEKKKKNWEAEKYTKIQNQTYNQVVNYTVLSMKGIRFAGYLKVE